MRKAISAAIFLAAFSLAASTAKAQLTFYYDPDTGNVALDTARVPTGEIWNFGIWLNPEIAGFEFLPDEFIPLTQSAFQTERPDNLADLSQSTTFGGYLTIGDVLPTNLTEDEWSSLDNWYYDPIVNERQVPGYWISSYRDGNRSRRVEEADFVYGQPDRAYENRWDLVDPDELDWAESATIVYDPLSGNVTIDTARGEEGGHISWFILESDGDFLPDNFTPWIDSPFTSATTDLIGFAADAVEPGVYSAGAILESGLTLEEVTAAFTSARFVGRAGFGGGSFDFETDGVDFAFAMLSTLPGDFNQDGSVDLLDLDILGRNFGKPGGPTEGDANADGNVDLLDLEALSHQGGFGVPQAVPEPTAVMLVVFAMAGIGISRR